MDELGDKVKDVKSESISFFKHVFNFDDENKSRMLNMMQYTVLAIIPVLLVLRGVKHFIPEEDESKGSIEILLESVGQILIIVLAIWFINKLITFVPTYSGKPYNVFNETTYIIPFVLILATMQTKLGAKFNILIDRMMDMWMGRLGEQQQQPQQQGQVRVSQPIAAMHQPSQADYLDRNQLLPSNLNLTAMPAPQATQMSKQTNPDFNQMYQHGANSMAAATSSFQEPMAANEGGGGWGSAW